MLNNTFFSRFSVNQDLIVSLNCTILCSVYDLLMATMSLDEQAAIATHHTCTHAGALSNWIVRR